MPRILILGGTGEALELAVAAAGACEVISALAGRTRNPTPPVGEVRIGGFGGVAGLARFLATRAIDRVIDATHPFAARITRNACEACAAQRVPRLRLLRPPWRPEPGDRWLEVADATAAAACLPDLGRRAFLTVGAGDLAPFGRVDGVRYLVRTIDPPAAQPLTDADWIRGRGPFAVADEIGLMRAQAVDVLVTKASGGDATYAKIAAARALDLPVVMIRRPSPPPGPLVDGVAAALAWLRSSPARAPDGAHGGGPARTSGCR